MHIHSNRRSGQSDSYILPEWTRTRRISCYFGGCYCTSKYRSLSLFSSAHRHIFMHVSDTHYPAGRCWIPSRTLPRRVVNPLFPGAILCIYKTLDSCDRRQFLYALIDDSMRAYGSTKGRVAIHRIYIHTNHTHPTRNLNSSLTRQ
jgi:hypothetical protein